MKERPILFSAPMVRAILDGTKTQTRRAIRKQFAADAEPAEVAATSPEGWQISGHSGLWWDDAGACIDDAVRCPYGQPGDRLWVREAFSGPQCMDASDGCKAVPPSKWGDCSRIWYWADGNPTDGDWTRPRPSIHMPRWASRILLEITAVRVERLQDISDADIEAEGAAQWVKDGGSVHSPHPGFDGQWPDAAGTVRVKPNRVVFCSLWESINGPQSWYANPWVWVIEFKRVEGGEA